MRLLTDHDAPAGRLQRCQVCGDEDLQLIIDCGLQPLCDTLLRPARVICPRSSNCPRTEHCTGVHTSRAREITDVRQEIINEARRKR